MHWWLADNETHMVDPEAISLCLDTDGNVTETSGSNFIIVKDGAVITPSRRNILWGVSLMTVTDVCGTLGIPFIERDIQVYDVVNADEAMLPSTPYCLLPVTRINGLAIGKGSPGPIFNHLIDSWNGLVGMDIRKQITEAA